MKKRIAFDVKGTLGSGPQQKKVFALFQAFEEQGCEMFVWSGVGSFATDLVRTLGLRAECMTKRTIHDTDPADLMDIAVEDEHQQTYLATKQLVFVDEIPDSLEDIAEFVRDLITHGHN